jgi:hypothetical protein
MGNGDPEVPKLPGVREYSWATLSLEDINMEAWSSMLRVGHEADNLTCKKKCVENLLRKKKVLEEAKAHL